MEYGSQLDADNEYNQTHELNDYKFPSLSCHRRSFVESRVQHSQAQKHVGRQENLTWQWHNSIQQRDDGWDLLDSSEVTVLQASEGNWSVTCAQPVTQRTFEFLASEKESNGSRRQTDVRAER